MEAEISKEEVRNKLGEIIQNGFSQPIIYLKKSPSVDSIKQTIADNNNILLHNTPIAASNAINGELMKQLFQANENGDRPELIDAARYGSWTLNMNQIKIAIEEFSNYIIQNTLIAFCSMMDYTGPIFRSIIDYLPIKQYVSDALNDGDITHFLQQYMYDCGKNSFGCLFDLDRTKEETYVADAARVKQYHTLMSTQLNQVIYTKICKACDKAITETLLGSRVSPNKTYIIDKGCKYYSLKETGIETAHEIYYKLNVDFVHLADKLMGMVVVPMCTNLFESDLFTSFFYIYQMGIGQDQSMDVPFPSSGKFIEEYDE